MSLQLQILLLPIVVACYFIYRHLTSISLTKVQGPRSDSFFHGNFVDLLHSQSGEASGKWHAMYGNVVKVTGPFTQPLLLISDPAALKYIYQTSGYRFYRHRERGVISRLLSGKGLTGVEGPDHKRQRKVMLPAFGSAESKALLPMFSMAASKMIDKWNDIIQTSPDQTSVVNIHRWVSRAALDAIGHAAFDYEFGALDNDKTALAASYNNLFMDIFALPTKASLVFLSIAQYLPAEFSAFLIENSGSPRIQRVRSTFELSRQVARELVQRKSQAILDDGNTKARDVMSLIVKANASESPATSLSEDEMLAQLQIMILAGHETTANSFSWTIFELCRQPEIQTRLRREVREMELKVKARGDTSFTMNDIESMPYLNAVVKESLRFNPVAPITHRQANQDDVLPLSKPITLTNGKIVHELPIPKGTKIMASIHAYNRLPEIFGDDADSFNPDRWLNNGPHVDKGANVGLGVYANLFTFSGGQRSCIGWRFAVLELQVLLLETINEFEFSLAVPAEQVRREYCSVTVPVLQGQVDKGVQLPIRIKAASRDEF
ncbi:cytochrome P450 [Mycena floridula]|nr:cytochrome P450 [Mycena floridula]